MNLSAMDFGLSSINSNPNKRLVEQLEHDIRILCKKDHLIKRDLDSLSKTIKKLTNITINFELTTSLGAYVVAPGITQDHVFNDMKRGSKWYSKQTTDIMKPGDLIRGTVDYKNIYVDGVFADIEFTSGIGKPMFDTQNGFSPRMVLAVLLHEFGHVFNYFILLQRTVATNYLQTEFVERLFQLNDEKIRYELYLEFEKKGHVLEEADKIVRSKSKEAAQTLIIRDHVRTLQSEMKEDLYDRRGNEALADQFAVRMGYGKELTRAQKIVETKFGTAFSPAKRFALNILHILFAMPVPGNIFALFYIVSFFSPPDMTYDRDTDRIDVIRQQLSAMLREPNLSRADKKSIIGDIDSIEHEWRKAKNYISFSNLIHLHIVARGVRGDMEMQKALEKLSNTRLHEAAARLEIA